MPELNLSTLQRLTIFEQLTYDLNIPPFVVIGCFVQGVPTIMSTHDTLEEAREKASEWSQKSDCEVLEETQCGEARLESESSDNN